MQDLRRDNVSNKNRFGLRSLINPTKSSQSSTVAKRSTAAQDNNEFIQEALQIHNELRQKHGVEPLRLNNDLSKLAQQWGR
jgi:uncharacterized protein YkwD